MTATQRTCRQRWAAEKRSRIADLRRLWKAYQEDPDRELEDLGTLDEYGLGFWYRAAERGSPGHWVWQLSWGGPSDEIRFYADAHNSPTPYRIAYAFLDWFDGYERQLRGRDLALLEELWSWFAEGSATERAYREAVDAETSNET